MLFYVGDGDANTEIAPKVIREMRERGVEAPQNIR
jgi:hypothetical protein